MNKFEEGKIEDFAEMLNDSVNQFAAKYNDKIIRVRGYDPKKI